MTIAGSERFRMKPQDVKKPGFDRAFFNLVPKRGLEPPLGYPN